MCWTIWVSWAMVATHVLAAGVTNLGKPISVPASQYWDGKDGPWSSFRIEVGTPPQQIRVLPASDQSSTWLVLPEACDDNPDKNCGADRGTTFGRNKSSTWEEIGSFELNTFLEQRVGLDGDGLYGNDTLSLGWTGDGLPSLERQTIVGMLTKDFYLGSLSLNPRPTNLTDYNHPIPSLMQNLRNLSTPIPSTTWSYTAGSHNLAPKIFGSLVLGGYDSTRFTPNDVVFPFGADISLDFQVAIQSVTTNLTKQPLLSNGIISYIDTLVADIWLPVDTCKLFEEAFGLVWNNETGLYLMNDTLHHSLLSKNPIVSFKVGPQVSGDFVTIDMPYFNFYQTATSAYIGNLSGLYFPLRRAANDSQYILGRTFLQSAYLSADYDRNTFNLSQARYPSSTTQENIVAIIPPRKETSLSDGDANDKSNIRLGTAAIAGIAVGGAALVVLVAVGIWIWLRRKDEVKGRVPIELEDTDPQHRKVHEADAVEIKHEIGAGLSHEVVGDSQPKAELSAGQEKPVEAYAGPIMHEMPADDPDFPRYEMEGEGHVKTSPTLSEAPPVHPGTSASDTVAYAENCSVPLAPCTGQERQKGWI